MHHTDRAIQRFMDPGGNEVIRLVAGACALWACVVLMLLGLVEIPES